MRRWASRRLLVAVAFAAVGSGCVAPGPEPSHASLPAESAARTPASSTGPTAPAASPTPAASIAGGDPTPIAEPTDVDPHLATTTILCESWGHAPPRNDIDCNLAVPVALSALGDEQAALARRLDVRYGDGCVADDPCDRRADVRTVIAISASFDSLVVRVARAASGELEVWPPVTGPRMEPASFRAPHTAAPDVGPAAPVELRTRVALPFCGTETMNVQDAFDTKARRCFLNGVLAWNPVELITTDSTGESGAVTHVLRFRGEGAIDDFVLTSTGWSASRCAIEPIRTIAVFLIDPPCERLAVQP